MKKRITILKEIRRRIRALAVTAAGVDIDDILHRNRQIAHVWGIDDVQGVRRDLDDDQSWKVLCRVNRYLDSEQGISWATIAGAAEDLYPLPKRAAAGYADMANDRYEAEIGGGVSA